jgi:hypothetical protein
MTRQPFTGRRSPGAFLCLVCKVYVTGTPSGHCPRCAFVPPTALELPVTREPESGAWWKWVFRESDISEQNFRYLLYGMLVLIASGFLYVVVARS